METEGNGGRKNPRWSKKGMKKGVNMGYGMVKIGKVAGESNE